MYLVNLPLSLRRMHILIFWMRNPMNFNHLQPVMCNSTALFSLIFCPVILSATGRGGWHLYFLLWVLSAPALCALTLFLDVRSSKTAASSCGIHFFNFCQALYLWHFFFCTKVCKRLSQKDHKFKVSHGYRVSLRPMWTT